MHITFLSPEIESVLSRAIRCMYGHYWHCWNLSSLQAIILIWLSLVRHVFHNVHEITPSMTRRPLRYVQIVSCSKLQFIPNTKISRQSTSISKRSEWIFIGQSWPGTLEGDIFREKNINSYACVQAVVEFKRFLIKECVSACSHWRKIWKIQSHRLSAWGISASAAMVIKKTSSSGEQGRDCGWLEYWMRSRTSPPACCTWRALRRLVDLYLRLTAADTLTLCVLAWWWKKLWTRWCWFGGGICNIWSACPFFHWNRTIRQILVLWVWSLAVCCHWLHWWQCVCSELSPWELVMYVVWYLGEDTRSGI